MNRLARVVLLENHSVTLKLLKSPKCAGCPSQCNEPLIDLFSLKNNLLSLSDGDLQYQLYDPENILSNISFLDQTINLSIENHDLLKTSGLYYFVPLIICLFGLSVGHFVGGWFKWSKDLTALSGLILGLLLSYVVLKSKASKTSLKFRPKVTISTFKGT